MEEALTPIEFEILQHRLWTILVEARSAVKRVSGTPTVAFGEAMSAIYTKEGDCALTATGVLLHVMGAPSVIRKVYELYDDIEEGDVFFSNDPWLGTAHTADQYMLMPIFHRGDIVAWAVTLTHCGEVGGIEPGSMSPSAKEIFHEGLLLPCLRVMKRWRMREDVLEMIRKGVRDPDMFILDMKAKLAGLEVIRRRFLEVVERYGVAKSKALLTRLIDMAERMARAKISRLPDARLRTVGYIDYDGERFVRKKIVCTMVKSGDELTFDFEGTDEANPSSMNCTYYGTLGSVFVALTGIMFWDAPWNSGLLRPVKVLAPEGSMVNCKWPSACGQAPPVPGKLITCLVTNLISRLMARDEELRADATACWSSESGAIHLGGINQYGMRFGTMIWESGHLAGTGACPDLDGCDDGGSQMHPAPSCPDVEVYEQKYPVLYLFRKHRVDSCGHGKHRGGTGVESAIMIYDARSPIKVGVSGGYGGRSITSYPLFGGLPPETLKCCYVRNLQGLRELIERWEVPNSLEEVMEVASRLGGEVEVAGAMHPSIALNNWDLIAAHTAQGGAGYGDPLERDPQLVLRDVEDGILSLETARRVYGVVLVEEDGRYKVDFAETEKLREAIRQWRLKESRRG